MDRRAYLKLSLAYRSKRQVFPTPESPIISSLICISYGALPWLICYVALAAVIVIVWCVYVYIIPKTTRETKKQKGSTARDSLPQLFRFGGGGGVVCSGSELFLVSGHDKNERTTTGIVGKLGPVRWVLIPEDIRAMPGKPRQTSAINKPVHHVCDYSIVHDRDSEDSVPVINESTPVPL